MTDGDLAVVVCSWAGDDPELAAGAILEAARQVRERNGRLVVVDSWPDQTVRSRVAGARGVTVVDAEPGTLLGAARQLGVEAAQARFVAFLDSDAHPRPGWLAALLRAAEEDDVAVAGGPVLPVWAGRLPLLFDTQPAYDFLSMMDLGGDPLEVPRVLPGNMVVDRELVGQDVFESGRGRVDGDLVGAEETMMMLRVVEEGNRIVYAPDAAVDHHSPRERLSWRWMWRRAEASGREAGSLGIRLEPLPRRFGWRDRAFLAACAPPYALGRLRTWRARQPVYQHRSDRSDGVAAHSSVSTGEPERLIRGTIAIQASTLASVVAFVAVATVLGRKLSLAEFGVYGLTLSFAAYVAFLQSSVEAAAVRAIAEARTRADRERAFTTTVVAYAGLGVVGGAVVAGLGTVLLRVLPIPDSLATDARHGLLLLAAMVALGWTLRSYHDALHGLQHFGAAARADTAGYVAFGAAVTVLALGAAPLWMLIAAGGSPMIFSGTACAVVARRLRAGIRFKLSALDRNYSRSYARFSVYTIAAGASDVVVSHLDRAILALFTNAATLGLYEAVSRPQLLVRQFHGTLSATVLPASTDYATGGDRARTRALALRGTRYVVAAVVPLALFITVLSGPLLACWLGERYAAGGWALSIFAAYWIFGANTGVLGSMLYAHGAARELAVLAWVIATVNLGLSLLLAPVLGLEGVVIGTTAAYALTFPMFLRLVTRTVGVHVSELAAVAWVPVYPVVAVLALALVTVRLVVPDTEPLAAVAIGVGALACTYMAMVAFVLDDDERAMFRAMRPWRSGRPA